jgi:Flp pilus assembly protein TadB
MNDALGFLVDLLSPFFGWLRPAVLSNLPVYGLFATIIVSTALVYYAPALASTIGRAQGRDRGRFGERLLRQLRSLRSEERGVRDQFTRMLRRDGREDGLILTDTDFFLFVRVGAGIGIAVLGLLFAYLLGTPAWAIAALSGYFIPNILAAQANRRRQRSILRDLPGALRRIQTRIASGADIRDALFKVSQKRQGPLYAELYWAAGQMSIPGNDQFDVLRELDERNDLSFFAPLADQVERAGKRGRNDAVEAFLGYIERVLEDDEGKRSGKIAGLPTKVTAGMVPFLAISLLIAVIAPYAIGFIGS